MTWHDSNLAFSRLQTSTFTYLIKYKCYNHQDTLYTIVVFNDIVFLDWRSVCAYVDDSWAVGAYEAGDVLAQQPVFDPHHVLLGDALSDANHQRDLRVNGLDDGRRRKRRRDINHSGIGPCALLRLTQRKKGGVFKGRIPK